MAEFKINISDPTNGKTKQFVVNTDILIGKRIGENINGDLLGIEELKGYELKITGGTDFAGFPMRPDIQGMGRKRILTGRSIGMRQQPEKGYRRRKTVVGNTISDKIVQVNTVIVKKGAIDIFAPQEQEEKQQEQGESSSEAS
ncbi:30S ribosomal protein S6e [Candidatus Woesearchaeota archaeon]|nr:30S ribosomal protein S6e [Candidatus Woesearchaeota archaeon]